MSHVIDLQLEDPLTLSQTQKRYFPQVSFTTLYRWATDGTHGVKLETIRVGKRRLTSPSAVQRFLDRLAEVEA